MASTLRKPLVIANGQIEQLQAGDTLDAVVTDITSSQLTNDNASPITVSQAVYIKSNGHVDLARSNAVGTSTVGGFVVDSSIAASASGTIQHVGPLSGFSGLTPGSIYYLDPTTAGAITATAPTTVGQFVCPVGVAISATVLLINIRNNVLL